MKHKGRTIDFAEKIIIFNFYDKINETEIEIKSENQTFKEVLRTLEEDLHNRSYDRYEIVEIMSAILGLKYQPLTRLKGEKENGDEIIMELLQYFGTDFNSSVLIKK
jgi:hypothetical protein